MLSNAKGCFDIWHFQVGTVWIKVGAVWITVQGHAGNYGSGAIFEDVIQELNELHTKTLGVVRTN